MCLLQVRLILDGSNFGNGVYLVYLKREGTYENSKQSTQTYQEQSCADDSFNGHFRQPERELSLESHGGRTPGMAARILASMCEGFRNDAIRDYEH